MTTQPTNLPVPSESPRDLKFNAGKIDEFVTSLVNTYIDRFGNSHYTIEGLRWLAQQAIAQFGWIPVESFQAGATLTLPNQILKDTASGEYYRWDGALPKVVPAGSTPATTGGTGVGAWVSVGDSALRSMLSNTSNAAYGDALVGVKQPFAGSVGRTQHDVNADMVINVKDSGGIGNGSASSVADIAAVQAAINAYAPMTTPVHVKIPRGTWNLSGITIPRRGVVLDLTEATIEASAGVVFSRSFPQLAAADFKAANPPLDGKQTYFRPIVIKGGTVNLSGTATFLEIRQPFLAEYSTWGKTLVMDDTQIKTYGNSIAFGIHGGWGFDFNSVAVTGDVTAATGFGASVGSGTCLYMRPDGTYNTSSHAQLISFNKCIISYCTVVDSNKGSNGGSAEALYFFNSNCMFVNGGTIDAVNLLEIVGGMFVTTIKEFIINRCAGVIISNIQAQRYNNPRTDARYGMFQFLGGGSEIKVDAVRCVAGSNLTGSMFGFYANNGEEFLEVSLSNFQYISGGVADLNEADTTKQTSVVRFLQFGTGKITGTSVRGLSGRQTHNLVDFSIATPGSINRMELKSIKNVGSTVKRRVLGLSANISNIDAPEMYAVNFIRMRSAAVGATATICAYENFRTQLTGSTLPVAVISNNTPVSNAVSISFSSWDNAGNVILGLNQASGLTAGMPVECTATLTLNSSESILL